MAENSKTEKSWERLDRLRVTQAVSEIAASPNLRFFIKQLLLDCGENSSPYAHDTIETARLCGRHEIYLELRSVLSRECPGLLAQLEKERENELVQRATGKKPSVGELSGNGSSTGDSASDASGEYGD